jgi:putative transposase
MLSAGYGRHMARVPRTSLPDGFFHVVARGVAGTLIYRSDDDRRRFLQLLGRCEERHRLSCHAYCLMSTHYHLVVGCTRGALSGALCEVNGIYARGFNRRHGRFGHLFAERFSARRIESEDYLYEACSYVLLNPVKAGLCAQIEDWPWSYSSFGLDSM